MRLFYWLRVAVVSLEAALLACAWLAWSQFHDELVSLSKGMSLNEELLKYLLLLPLGLGAWVAAEVRQLLHEDKQTTQVLTAWPDYWRLKTHVWVALCYALLFAGASIVPWIVKAGISSPGGFLLFVVSIAGQLIVSASVYIARLQIREYVVNASAA